MHRLNKKNGIRGCFSEIVLLPLIRLVNSLLRQKISLLLGLNSLLIISGNSTVSHCNCIINSLKFPKIGSKIHIFPVFSRISGNLTRRQVRFWLRSPPNHTCRLKYPLTPWKARWFQRFDNLHFGCKVFCLQKSIWAPVFCPQDRQKPIVYVACNFKWRGAQLRMAATYWVFKEHLKAVLGPNIVSIRPVAIAPNFFELNLINLIRSEFPIPAWDFCDL